MFVKFQQLDTNCFHILNSRKTTPFHHKTGLTVNNKSNSNGQQIQHQQVIIERPNGKKAGFVKYPDGRIQKNGKFGGESSGKNGVFDKDKVGPHGFLTFNPNGRIQRNEGEFSGGFEEKKVVQDGRIEKNGLWLRSESVVNGGLHTDVCPPSSSSSNSGKTDVFKKDVMMGNRRSKQRGKVKSEEKIAKSKCSTKYGGSLPAMLEALETAGDNLDEALKPWEKSLTNKERTIILKEQLRWERALEIFEWFKRKGCFEVNVIHYNIMLRILGRAQRWEEVQRLWNEMAETGIRPINSTYGTLIDVYSKGGRREDAVRWLDLMNQHGIEPDEVTMGIVVQMYKKAGDFNKAEGYFNQWSLSSGGVQDTSVCFSAYTYNTLIDTYGKALRVKEARHTFDQMLKDGIVPTTVTFNSMIHMYGNNAQLDEVASLMQKMEQLKCPPDTRTYNILISLHAKHDDIRTAANYLKKMKDASLEPDVVSYRTLLYALSIRHMVSESEELIREMDERGVDIDEFTQSSVMRMYIEAGMLESSWSWFQRFHIAANNMTSSCYSANIDAFGERGHFLEAEKVFYCCMEKKKLSVLVFNVMIKAYGISKRFDQACRIFDSMKEHGIAPDKCSYNSLVQMLASANLPQKAELYVRRMQAAGLLIDCVPYCAVISSYAKLGKMDSAVGLYNDMIGIGIKPDVVIYGVLINAFADTGSVKEALCYVNAMRSWGLLMNAVICKSLIKLYTKVGYLREAEETYKMLHSFEADDVDVYSSNCMIDLYSERSMILEAEEIFENLKKNGAANEFTYAMMLCMYKKNGRFVEAFWIARKMRDLGLMTDLLSYNNVLGLYACDGRYKEAAATFREMLKASVQPDDSTFKSLGNILLKCGVPKEALDKLEQKRKKDAQSGLQAWTLTLSSVIGL